MTVRRLLCTSAFVLPAAILSAPHVATSAPQLYAAEQDDLRGLPPAAWAADDPADSLYKSAREALNANNFRRAADLFGQIGSRFPRSTYAAEALYWRAFALYRIGGESELKDAQRILASHKTRFPRASTTRDAEALGVRINGELARRGDPDAAAEVSKDARKSAECPPGSAVRDDDSDIRAAAMNALLQMGAEQALPIIKQVLQKRDACSVALRSKAVFMLSQKQTSETESLMMDVVRNDPSREVREQAVFWLGQVHSERAQQALMDIATTGDGSMREKAIFALGQQGMSSGQAFVRKLAESPDTPSSAREQAIFQLGQRRSQENADFLRALFLKLGKGDTNEDMRKKVLFSLSQMRGYGNAQWLLNVALDQSQGEDVRKHALWTAGQAGIPGSELITLYDRLTDAPLKEQLIWVLSESRDPAATDKLIEIAKSDRNQEMRKKALFWLGQKNDPRVRQLLLDIINGK